MAEEVIGPDAETNERLKKELEEEQKEQALLDADEEEQRLKEQRLRELVKRQRDDGRLLTYIAGPDEAQDSEEDINFIMDGIMQEREMWCSESKEVHDYRAVMDYSVQADIEEYRSVHGHDPPPSWLAPLSCRLPTPSKEIDKLKPRSVLAEVTLCIDNSSTIDTKVMLCIDDSAAAALDYCYQKFRDKTWKALESCDPCELVFKAPGVREYIYGPTPLKDFRNVRKQLQSQVHEVLESKRPRATLKLLLVRMPQLRLGKGKLPLQYQYEKVQMQEPVHHQDITFCWDSDPLFPSDPAMSAEHISVWDIDLPLTLTLNGIYNIEFPLSVLKKHNVTMGNDLMVCLIAELCYAGKRLCEPWQTPWRSVKNIGARKGASHLIWGSPSGDIVFENIKLSDLPRETRLCLSACICNPALLEEQKLAVKEKNLLLSGFKTTFNYTIKAVNVINPVSYVRQPDSPFWFLGWVNTTLFDHYGLLMEGTVNLPLWAEDKKANPIGIVTTNSRDPAAPRVSLGFPRFPKRVIFPEGEPPPHKFQELLEWEQKELEVLNKDPSILRLREKNPGDPAAAHFKYLKKLIETDPLYQLSRVDRILLWHYRKELSRIPKALTKFLQAVDWCKPAAVFEAQTLLNGGEIDFYRENNDLAQSPMLSNRSFGGASPGMLAALSAQSPPQSPLSISRGTPISSPALSPVGSRGQLPVSRNPRCPGWLQLSYVNALELLDARFPDGHVREAAVKFLEDMADEYLEAYILQLVQVLKYESYHYNSLARFLLRRMLRSPFLIGQPAFWHLKAEMWDPKMSERHGLIIEEFLKRSPLRRELLKQIYVTNRFLNAAVYIKDNVKEKSERGPTLQDLLRKTYLPPVFTLPLDPRMQVSGIVYEKCKVMDSKKQPLWLTFKNSDPGQDTIKVMFKAGDDLRQDLLTLQMLAIMDKLWKERNLDLHIRAYGCIATDDGVGMIEVVDNSDTVANITRNYGGANAAYFKEPLLVWLENNQKEEEKKLEKDKLPEPTSPRTLSKKDAAKVEKPTPPFVDRFVRSCAGYCPATYVLGIGDRHNDNIMLTRPGDLFHIDFGHFLGNFKEKFGFKRETAPFIFTPMYAHVMGGKGAPQYKRFCKLSCLSFGIVRKHASLLINLFTLMLSTGIPELQKPEDIYWLREVLLLRRHVLDPGLTDAEADQVFLQKIEESLANKKAVFNDYMHILAH